jgi:glycosyltransferase involved in cell wall biosynthesis
VNLLFIVPYPPGQSPSQRFRFEQYLDLLSKEGHGYEMQSFLQASNWKLFATRGKLITKIITLLSGYLKRMSLLFRLGKFDRVFIHREAAPLGPPVLEWIIAKVFRKKVIYDFDDAIWLTDQLNENSMERFLRWRKKVATVCRISYRVSCGNSYLASFAGKYNNAVIVNPTTIDTDLTESYLRKRSKDHSGITLGWTGSRSTLRFLEKLGDVVKAIVRQYPHVSFCVIADETPAFAWPSTKFVRWSLETEIDDLLNFDIGVMPLPDDEWTRGKCGFKALQYMALGIPAVASPVGVNSEIIEDGVSGFLASSDAEWIECLGKLINDSTLRGAIGNAGRLRVVNNYSVASNAARFLSILK